MGGNSPPPVTIRTRKFIRNMLLMRSQFVSHKVPARPTHVYHADL